MERFYMSFALHFSISLHFPIFKINFNNLRYKMFNILKS